MSISYMLDRANGVLRELCQDFWWPINFYLSKNWNVRVGILNGRRYTYIKDKNFYGKKEALQYVDDCKSNGYYVDLKNLRTNESVHCNNKIGL